METAGIMADSNASFLRAARAGNLEKVLDYLKENIDINTSNANGLNALHLAAKEGHVDVVTELLKNGANVNAATKKGNTALHIASLAGQDEVVKVLVNLGANVNVQSQNGFTPLYMAAQENHDGVVSFLLANKANQSLATEDGFTPLAVALQQGHDKVVAVLLENDTKGRVRLPALHIAAKKDDCKAATLLLQNDHNPDITSKSGFTPLHIAAHYGNEKIANILLDKGADVNYAAKHQITPLHVASKWGKANMVGLLIEKGAKIESVTRDGLTPLHCAARSGHDQVVDLLLEKGAPILAKTKNGLAPLHMASQGDHVDSARILLYHKAPVDDVTVDYLTALHVAAHCGHVKVAKLLLDRKADPNARALNGFTPLHIACKKNRIKVVELLLKHGASIEATTESGLSPLHVASFMGCMNIVIYLIQSGANPDVPTVRGETPLHLAARANQIDIIRILLRNGASVDARAREEQTPLHIAARLGNVDIVSLLLQHGAAVDATTKDMYTALHIAAKEGQEEVVAVLLDHEASLTATTKRGFTPLHLAAKYGNIKVIRLLLQKDAPVDAQGKNGLTPLHVAAHYNHVNEALLLLEKGASPHATAKNGYTPLHIAAKKNQMDIATTLLEYGAKCNAESKAGYIPLHLSSQEGHTDVTSLLIEHQANVNSKANNGLTPLHLCAQEDRVNVATVLVKNGAEIGPQTNAGYTPLHVASHFGQMNMVRFLLQNNADVRMTTEHGYTPLHQAAQQGHTPVVNLLLENKASPNVTTVQGQTPLSIAQRLGYISVVETLKVVTETTVTTTTTTVTEEKYKVVAPEIMQETFMTDSEDEGGEDTMLGDQSYRYLTADEMKSLGDDSLPIDVTKDEKHHEAMHMIKDTAAPMVEEDNISPQHITPMESGFNEKFSPDNIDISRAPVHAGSFSYHDECYTSFPEGMLRSSGRLKWKTFLVSFMVDARGGAMRGCRHSGVRVIIPPRKASMPMRITCRYLRKEKLMHPPPLMEGEACASRILEVGPIGARFLGPVIIEVPHFASLRGREREVTILRSDTGETWREHALEASEEAVQDVLNESFEGDELSALEDLNTNRITRILTADFPQYFAIVTRIRQEVHGVGPEGGMVSSTVVPQVQAIFPEGALQKKIRVGLQAQPIAPELVAKLLGNRVAVSPIVTVEPRRRKFHKPITLTIPVPQAATKGMINQYSGDAPTLRLLCSITGGSSKAQWEDVTGSTPLTFVNDCVSFTTTVSARFWLMDCRKVNEVSRYATELYQEAVHVPFMAKFVIFAKRHDPNEAQLRVFCMTDDKEDKTLETQEHFTEIAKSRDVEVLEGKLQYLEFVGNLVPVTNSGEQLKFIFHAFHENRLPFVIRVKNPHGEPMGRIAFMKEPKVGKGEPPQTPICNLNIAMPEVTTVGKTPVTLELVTLEKKYDFMQEAGLSKPESIHRANLRLSDIARELDKDWVVLANELCVSEADIDIAKSEFADDVPEQALTMLRMWLQKSGSRATGNELEKALRKINRADIIKKCMFNVELVTDDVEKAVAKVHLDQSGFDVLKEELGSSREASMRRGVSLDAYDEQDIMKEAESAAETSSETGSLFERDQISHIFSDEKENIQPLENVTKSSENINNLSHNEQNQEEHLVLTTKENIIKPVEASNENVEQNNIKNIVKDTLSENISDILLKEKNNLNNENETQKLQDAIKDNITEIKAVEDGKLIKNNALPIEICETVSQEIDNLENLKEAEKVQEITYENNVDMKGTTDEKIIQNGISDTASDMSPLIISDAAIKENNFSDRNDINKIQETTTESIVKTETIGNEKTVQTGAKIPSSDAPLENFNVSLQEKDNLDDLMKIEKGMDKLNDATTEQLLDVGAERDVKLIKNDVENTDGDISKAEITNIDLEEKNNLVNINKTQKVQDVVINSEHISPSTDFEQSNKVFEIDILNSSILKESYDKKRVDVEQEFKDFDIHSHIMPNTENVQKILACESIEPECTKSSAKDINLNLENINQKLLDNLISKHENDHDLNITTVENNNDTEIEKSTEKLILRDDIGNIFLKSDSIKKDNNESVSLNFEKITDNQQQLPDQNEYTEQQNNVVVDEAIFVKETVIRESPSSIELFPKFPENTCTENEANNNIIPKFDEYSPEAFLETKVYDNDAKKLSAPSNEILNETFNPEKEISNEETILLPADPKTSEMVDVKTVVSIEDNSVQESLLIGANIKENTFDEHFDLCQVPAEIFMDTPVVETLGSVDNSCETRQEENPVILEPFLVSESAASNNSLLNQSAFDQIYTASETRTYNFDDMDNQNYDFAMPDVTELDTSNDSDSREAKLRRVSKTPPPSPVEPMQKEDEKEEEETKPVELPPEQIILNEVTTTVIKSTVVEDIVPVEPQGPIPKLTESETWPSGEMDTSQVSISSLPDDEKSEPTTATVSSAIAEENADKVLKETKEWTEVDESGTVKHVIQKTTHMTILRRENSDQISEIEGVLEDEVDEPRPEEKIIESEKEILNQSDTKTKDVTLDESAQIQEQKPEISGEGSSESLKRLDEKGIVEPTREISEECLEISEREKQSVESDLVKVEDVTSKLEEIEKDESESILEEEKETVCEISSQEKILNTDFSGDYAFQDQKPTQQEISLTSVSQVTESSQRPCPIEKESQEKSPEPMSTASTEEKLVPSQLDKTEASESLQPQREEDISSHPETLITEKESIDSPRAVTEEIKVTEQSLEQKFSIEEPSEEHAQIKESSELSKALPIVESYEDISKVKQTVTEESDVQTVCDLSDKQDITTQSVSKTEIETDSEGAVVKTTTTVITTQRTVTTTEICDEKETVSKTGFVPLAFDNTAFVGAELIDACENISECRSRSPYEVVRSDFGSSEYTSPQESTEEPLQELAGATISPIGKERTRMEFQEEKTVVRRKPILSHIPSEISEEDLVETEISSPGAEPESSPFEVEEFSTTTKVTSVKKIESQYIVTSTGSEISSQLGSSEIFDKLPPTEISSSRTEIISTAVKEADPTLLQSGDSFSETYSAKIRETTSTGKFLSEESEDITTELTSDASDTAMPSSKVFTSEEKLDFESQVKSAIDLGGLTSPESDTGVPTSPFEIISEGEFSDNEQKSMDISQTISTKTLSKTELAESHDSCLTSTVTLTPGEDDKMVSMQEEKQAPVITETTSVKEIKDSLKHVNGPDEVVYKPEYDDHLESKKRSVLDAKLDQTAEFTSAGMDILLSTMKQDALPKHSIYQEADDAIDQGAVGGIASKDTGLTDELYEEKEDIDDKIYYCAISDDTVDHEIGIVLSSDVQSEEDIIERPQTPEPPIEPYDIAPSVVDLESKSIHESDFKEKSRSHKVKIEESAFFIPEDVSEAAGKLTTISEYDTRLDEEFEIIDESELEAVLSSEANENLSEGYQGNLRKMGSFKDISTVHLTHGLEDDTRELDGAFSSPLLPSSEGSEESAGFVYGMQFERDLEDHSEEAMDIDSDQYSEEKEVTYNYGMRFEREHELEEEDIPCYGDLYTHQEEDEDVAEEIDKVKQPAAHKADFDILAGRKFFTKSGELDDVSMSSLQEFERLEEEIRSGRRSSIGSVDSFNGKQYHSKSGEHDDISMNSLTEFEKLERECSEAERMEAVVQEANARLSEIEEGHESQTSEASQETLSDAGKGDYSDNVEDYNDKLTDIGGLLKQKKIDAETLDKTLSMQCADLLSRQIETTRESGTVDFSKETSKLCDSSKLQIVTDLDSIPIDNLNLNLGIIREPIETVSFIKTDTAVIKQTETIITSTAAQIGVLESKSKEFAVEEQKPKNYISDDLSFSAGSEKFEDIEQDSLREDRSIKPDSLSGDDKCEYQDSLHEDKSGDVDSLLDEIREDMRDSLHEEKIIEDDSLHEMDILPDESSLSLESSLAAVVDVSHDSLSEKVDVHQITAERDFDTDSLKGLTLSSALESGFATQGYEVTIVETGRGGDIMASSTDSLERSSSAATHATYQFETESLMSSSLNSVQTSDDYTMVSSADNFDPETISIQYGNVPGEIIIKEDSSKVFMDSEGNIQTHDFKTLMNIEKDIHSIMKLQDSGEFSQTGAMEVRTCTTTTTTKKLNDEQIAKHSVYPGTRYEFKEEEHGGHTYDKFEYGSSQQFDPDVEIEEINTIDEHGNPKVIKKVKRTVRTTHTYTSSAPSEDMEEKMKEFLIKQAREDEANKSEEKIQEERTLDDKGNIVIVRTVQHKMTTDPVVHCQSFKGPDAEKSSDDFISKFQSAETEQNVQEFENVDEDGNILRITKQIVMKPEVRTVSFTGPDAHEQMKAYMKQWQQTQDISQPENSSVSPQLQSLLTNSNQISSTNESTDLQEEEAVLQPDSIGTDTTEDPSSISTATTRIITSVNIEELPPERTVVYSSSYSDAFDSSKPSSDTTDKVSSKNTGCEDSY